MRSGIDPTRTGWRRRGAASGPSWATRRQHRDRGPPDPAADVPRQRRCRDLGGTELSLGPGGHGGPVGRFADMWGHKLLYVYGFGIFIVGSALCGLAPSLGALIGFRALQAVGAALLQANSVAIIVLAVPKGSLGKAIGIQGAAQAVGLALGPTVGGFSSLPADGGSSSMSMFPLDSSA